MFLNKLFSKKSVDKKVERQLKNLRVYNDDEIITVLLVGQSGAGKSTLINILVNLFKFKTLDEAAVCLISRFVIC